MSALRVLLADDHTLVRAGIRALVGAVEGAVIVAEADNGRDAVALAKQHHPDITVMDISMRELNGIEAIRRGEVYVSSRVSQCLVAGLAPGQGSHESPLEALSPRQREILQLIAEGRSTKEIAFALSVSVKTIETHRAALMNRLGIHDVAGLVLFAARHRLVSVDRPDE